MKVSKTALSAVAAVEFLSRQHPQHYVQSTLIAEHLGMANDSTLKILQTLVRRGVLVSQLGRRGGYCLAPNSHRTTMLDILEAMDGPLRAAIPTLDSGVSQNLDAMGRIWEKAADDLRQQLDAMTLLSPAA